MIYEIVEELKNLNIDYDKPLFMDTETGGSHKHTKDIDGELITTEENYTHIVTVQLYQEHWDKVKVFIISNLPSYALEFLWSEISKATMIGHNLGYDLMQFKRHVSNFSTKGIKWEDTFYLSRLSKPSWQEYSLDKCLTRVLGYDPYAKEGLTKKDMQVSFSPNHTPDHAQLMYASIDVYLLPKLYHEVKSYVGTFIYELDKRIAEIATKIIDRGMPVDTNKLREIDRECDIAIEETKELLGDMNVNSYRQVRQALGLEYSSDEITLRIIAGRENGLEGYRVFKHPKLPGKNVLLEPNYVHSEAKVDIANAIIKQRKHLKMKNFVKRAKSWMDEHHRITSRFSPHAISGRVQGSDENLSQYPRAMKKMWGINSNYHGDRVLIYADYSQLELRTICAILPERNMEEAYRKDIDLHVLAASNIDVDESKLPKSLPKRTLAKYLNFLNLYGGGVANFQKTVCKWSGVWIEYDICSKAAKDWKQGFSDIKHWHEVNAKSKGHMGSTISGRRYKAKSYTDLNNIQVQGSGAEVFKQAVNYLFKYDVAAGAEGTNDVYLVNLVHDAVVLDAPNDPEVYEKAARNLAKCFQKAWFDIMQQAPIKDLPMPVDVLVGQNWADLEYEVEGKVLYKYELDGMYMLDKELKDEI